MMHGCAPAPELRIPNAASKNGKVSVARIRLDSWRSVGPFKEIICGDVSEFESYMASQPVLSPICRYSARLRLMPPNGEPQAIPLRTLVPKFHQITFPPR